MAITRRVDTDRYKQKIVTSVVALAENIGATLIAEGVETQTELDTLRSLGVCYAQGFLLGRPSPIHEVVGSRSHEVEGLSNPLTP